MRRIFKSSGYHFCFTSVLSVFIPSICVCTHCQWFLRPKEAKTFWYCLFEASYALAQPTLTQISGPAYSKTSYKQHNQTYVSKTVNINFLYVLVFPISGIGNSNFSLRKRVEDDSLLRTIHRLKRIKKMSATGDAARYLTRIPGIISHWKSFLAWVLDQNLQMFNDYNGTAG